MAQSSIFASTKKNQILIIERSMPDGLEQMSLEHKQGKMILAANTNLMQNSENTFVLGLFELTSNPKWQSKLESWEKSSRKKPAKHAKKYYESKHRIKISINDVELAQESNLYREIFAEIPNVFSEKWIAKDAVALQKLSTGEWKAEHLNQKKSIALSCTPRGEDAKCTIAKYGKAILSGKFSK